MIRSKAAIAVLAAFLALCSATHAENQPRPGAEQQQRLQRGPQVKTNVNGPGVPPAPSFEGAAPNIDLEELLARVAASSDKEFLIDRRARAHIYVGGTSLEEPSYPLLLSILRANGLAAVEIEGRVHVLPAADARQLPGRLVQRDDAKVSDDEWVTRVITVRNGNAARLVPILRPLLPQEAHLAAMVEEGDRSSKLIIVDRYANVRRITEVVDALTQ
jgi:type II secretory pathway component GspD/PulD (secretin)